MSTDQTKTPVTEVEDIKATSRWLRGTLAESLQDPLTGAIAPDDTQLSKFHGIYQQDDRDLRSERRKQKLEPHYQFMIRIRVPGGIATPEQWLQVDALAHSHANGTIKLTTRQAFQFHGIIKRNLKASMQKINQVALDTIAACGDVNRNVMCSANPHASPAHAEVYEWSCRLSDHLTPRTGAYREIWLDGKKLEDGEVEEEPIYGKTYLPRKFKIAMAIPPHNDSDVYSQDLGFTAVVENGNLVGFNVSVGGGMGMTHGDTATYPRLADVIGFVTPDQVLQTAEEVVKIQRDFGDRTNRKHARMKYTLDDRGIEWFQDELQRRLGWNLQAARDIVFEGNGDQYGWLEGTDGKGYYTLFVQNGRVLDTPDYPMMTGLREIAKVHTGDFRLTGNQNLIIGGVESENRSLIEALLKEYKLEGSNFQTGLRLNSMACVAFPTCSLAMAESERYLPSLLEKLDAVMVKLGLQNEPIVIRMTGCPNGCARPYLGEIGFVGKAPGKYNVYLGAGFTGDRLNKLYRENIGEAEILIELESILSRFAKEKTAHEHFGDFVTRVGIVKATRAGMDFHA